MPKGVFVGLATIDVVYRVDQFPAANSKIVASSQDVYVGGPATNASVTFAHLGGSSVLISGVGSHALAGVIKHDLQEFSVGLIDLNPKFEQPPPISAIAVNARGERNVVSANSTRNTVPPAHVDEAALEGVSIVMVDGHFMEASQAWAKAARSRGVRVVFDGGSWKEGTAELLKTVDIAVCSADFKPPGCTTEDQVLSYLQGQGVQNVAITHGGEPVRFVSPTSSGTVKVPSVERVDTMGAGDVFHGAFCYYAASGQGLVAALAEATGVAAESCRYNGTREWMRVPA